MKRILLPLTLLFILTSFAHSTPWIYTLNQAKIFAKANNKLILIDFYAHWCGPCKKMDEETWLDDEVLQQLDRVVAAKINVDNNRSVAASYGIKSIPSLFITDAWGNILYQEKGYKTKSQILKLLSEIPDNTKEIYNEMRFLENNKKDPVLITNVAISYQKAALPLSGKIRSIFLRSSNSYLRTAKKYFKKDKNSIAIEHSDLLRNYNDIIGGHPNSAVKTIEKKGVEKFKKENTNFALFVLIQGLLQKKEMENAKKYFEILKEKNKSNLYVEELQKNYTEELR